MGSIYREFKCQVCHKKKTNPCDRDIGICQECDNIIRTVIKMQKNPEQYLKEIGQDEVFHIFHSILWRINATRTPQEKVILLDKEIHEAIEDLFKSYGVTQ
ncbi:MAG: hypothetical protein Q8O88_01555 [bacterium]|nr:hypothetical protein [bacterium]